MRNESLSTSECFVVLFLCLKIYLVEGESPSARMYKNMFNLSVDQSNHVVIRSNSFDAFWFAQNNS